MLIDLSLKGRQVVVVGAGREAARKIAHLVSQNCEIHVVADDFADSVQKWANEKRLSCIKMHVTDTRFLNDYDRLILVMAVTNDRELNRRVGQAARDLGCYAYCVDDPEFSDFSHPAVINVQDTIQIAVSTGGKSPLMAKHFRAKLEKALPDLFSQEDLRKVELQSRLRAWLKEKGLSPVANKRFLEEMLNDTDINALLAKGNFSKAEATARSRFEEYTRP